MAACDLHTNEQVYKNINPKKYLKDYLSKGIRPQNDRGFLEYRPCVVSVDVLSKCLSSSLVKIGNTTVLCGIRGEFRKPQRKSQDTGFIQINTKIPDISSPDSNQRNLSQSMKLCTSFLNRLFIGMKIIDPKELCVFKGELVWVFHIDVLCLNYDGGLWDAAVIAIYMALKTILLPKLEFCMEKHNFTINENLKEPLNIKDCPISTTFGVFEEIILADPSLKEERYCRSLFNILIDNDNVKVIQKQGGYQISFEQLKGCTDLAKSRYSIMKAALDEVLETHNKKIKRTFSH